MPIDISTKQNKKEKKQQCNERCLEIDHRRLTPHVFSILRGMGRECSTFNNRLAKNIAEKRELYQSIVTNWIRTKICIIEGSATMFTWIKEP